MTPKKDQARSAPSGHPASRTGPPADGAASSDAVVLRTLAANLDVVKTLKEHRLEPGGLAAILHRAAKRAGKPDPAGAEEITIFVDGACRGNPGPSSAAFVIQAGGRLLEAQGQFLGECTNNQAEYNALILALLRALELGARKVMVKSDSELMVRQMRGEYKVKNRGLMPLSLRAFKLIQGFESFAIDHIPREENREADRLANRALDEFADEKALAD